MSKTTLIAKFALKVVKKPLGGRIVKIESQSFEADI